MNSGTGIKTYFQNDHMPKTLIFSILFLYFSLPSFAQWRVVRSNEGKIRLTNSVPVKIKWVKELKGNFSFKNKWEYPEGVFRNSFGQLICDGFCPEEVENMFGPGGRIKKDSLKSFYKFVDTSHIPHSLSSTARCYEWAGTEFIEATRKSPDTVFLASATNAGTHCSLELTIAGDICYPVINLISIVFGGSAVYYCTDGFITIDKTFWDKGIIKAIFSFNFRHDKDPGTPMFWKGKIYAKINPGRTNRDLKAPGI